MFKNLFHALKEKRHYCIELSDETSVSLSFALRKKAYPWISKSGSPQIIYSDKSQPPCHIDLDRCFQTVSVPHLREEIDTQLSIALIGFTSPQNSDINDAIEWDALASHALRLGRHVFSGLGFELWPESNRKWASFYTLFYSNYDLPKKAPNREQLDAFRLSKMGNTKGSASPKRIHASAITFSYYLQTAENYLIRIQVGSSTSSAVNMSKDLFDALDNEAKQIAKSLKIDTVFSAPLINLQEEGRFQWPPLNIMRWESDLIAAMQENDGSEQSNWIDVTSTLDEFGDWNDEHWVRSRKSKLDDGLLLDEFDPTRPVPPLTRPKEVDPDDPVLKEIAKDEEELTKRIQSILSRLKISEKEFEQRLSAMNL